MPTAALADGEDEKEVGCADAAHLQAGDGEGADDHRARRHDVDPADHAGAFLRRAPRLHGGEGGNDEEAAGDGDAEEIDGDVEGRAAREKHGEAALAGRRCAGAGDQGEVEHEGAHDEGGERASAGG